MCILFKYFGDFSFAEKYRDLYKQTYKLLFHQFLMATFENNYTNKEGYLKRFWKFLKSDSWGSLIVTLIIAFVLIKLVFFPLLSFLTGTQLPLVIVESCSMYHSQDLEGIMENEAYTMNNLSLNDTTGWSFKNGLNKGDVIFVVGAKNARVGNVVIFDSGGNAAHPIIHRIIKSDSAKITTKGDHNNGLLPYEQDVSRNRLVGKAVFRVPYIGWIKLIFYEFSKSTAERGLCS